MNKKQIKNIIYRMNELINKCLDNGNGVPFYPILQHLEKDICKLMDHFFPPEEITEEHETPEIFECSITSSRTYQIEERPIQKESSVFDSPMPPIPEKTEFKNEGSIYDD